MYGDDKKEAFIKEYLRSKVIIETSLYAILKKVKPFKKNFGKVNILEEDMDLEVIGLII